MPLVFWIGRICEEFACTPSVALRELEVLPDGFIEQLIEARAYAATKRACDAATSRKERPTGPLADLVTEIEFALAQEE